MGFLYSQLFVKPVYPTRPFTGETVVVTGANVGLGKEAARHMARLNAGKVILAVRNVQSGEEARRDILKTTGRDASAVEVWALDLASTDSIKAFAARAASLPRVDVLLENAGVALMNFQLNKNSGREMTIDVNVVGTFLLAALMLPKMRATAADFNTQPRLTIVSSDTHAYGGLLPRKVWRDEPNMLASLSDPSKASMMTRYPLSKLLEVMAVREMAPRMGKSGGGVVLNVLNPGLCKTELDRNALGPLRFFMNFLRGLLARTSEVGSRTLVAAAAAGPESHGQYMHDGVVDEGAVGKFVKSAEGKEASAKLWRELGDLLDGISPGVMGDLRS